MSPIRRVERAARSIIQRSAGACSDFIHRPVPSLDDRSSLGIHMTRRPPMPRQSTNRRGEDDKHLFPYYQGGPLMRSGSDTAKRYL
ncbi:hypothetical protein NDS46_13335 [Paenibacillus thiaminolyticus]|uniref:hypothetical protein n=1 Tax=Paenibacillus thiaminolyticus TaxID=49283 RepID=UPI00232E919F|nr:hypothetical protein [Paenibacillus thiaminolyticus]WCF10762.1 hypothetical protein NDS46_13335 [Paenibacillus thiaminolyticus]